MFLVFFHIVKLEKKTIRNKNGQRTQGVGWIPRHLETKKGVVPTKCSGELETSDNPEIPE